MISIYNSIAIIWIFLIVTGNTWLIIGIIKGGVVRKSVVNLYNISVSASTAIIALFVLPAQLMLHAFPKMTSAGICRISAYASQASIMGNIWSQLVGAYYEWLFFTKGIPEFV